MTAHSPSPEERRALALRATDVVKSYGSVRALDSAALDVGVGQMVALVGESGSGKTTLLRCFNRMVTPDAGEILVEDRDAAKLDPVLLRRSIVVLIAEA